MNKFYYVRDWRIVIGLENKEDYPTARIYKRKFFFFWKEIRNYCGKNCVELSVDWVENREHEKRKKDIVNFKFGPNPDTIMEN